jgi:aspartate aminotransferase
MLAPAHPHLAPRVTRIRPSPTAVISERLRELKAAGREVINLGEGELDFETPENAAQAGVEAILRGDTKYTSVGGTRELKEAIANKFRHENDLHFQAEELIAASGAKQIIFNALLATVREGDEVIVPAPYWVSYPDMVRLADGTPRVVACEENAGWKLRPEALAAAITPHTRWVLLNSPNNPTGAVYSAADLKALAEVLLAHPHVLILSDDIYERILYDGDFATLAQVEPKLRERVLTVNGVSKSYSMTGWRLGYAGGPAWLVGAIEKLQSQSTSNPSSISQAASVEALRGDQAFLSDWNKELKTRRDEAVRILSGAPQLRCRPSPGAFYLFVNCAGAIGQKTTTGRVIESDSDFAKFLVDEGGVGTVAGEAFGASPFLRVAYAVPLPTLRTACSKIVQSCRLLG